MITSLAIPTHEQAALAAEAAKYTAALDLLRELTITSKEGADFANDRLHAIKAQAKEYEARRTSVTKPLLDVKRTIDDWFRPVATALAGAEQILKGKIADYTRRTEDDQRAAMLAVAAGDPTALALTAPPVPLAGINVRTVWDAEIADPDAVPRELCSPDLAKIKQAIWYADTDAEPRPIPGVRFVRKDRVTVR